MEKPAFRLPTEMGTKDARTPVSTRLRETTKKTLKEAAKTARLSLDRLISNILDDYVSWLNKQAKK